MRIAGGDRKYEVRGSKYEEKFCKYLMRGVGLGDFSEAVPISYARHYIGKLY
jgi:hypothetical protein